MLKKDMYKIFGHGMITSTSFPLFSPSTHDLAMVQKRDGLALFKKHLADLKTGRYKKNNSFTDEDKERIIVNLEEFECYLKDFCEIVEICGSQLFTNRAIIKQCVDRLHGNKEKKC